MKDEPTAAALPAILDPQHTPPPCAECVRQYAAFRATFAIEDDAVIDPFPGRDDDAPDGHDVNEGEDFRAVPDGAL